MLTVLMLVSLFFAIWFTQVNLLKAAAGHAISKWNFIIQSAATVAFIYLKFWR